MFTTELQSSQKCVDFNKTYAERPFTSSLGLSYWHAMCRSADFFFLSLSSCTRMYFARHNRKCYGWSTYWTIVLNSTQQICTGCIQCTTVVLFSQLMGYVTLSPSRGANILSNLRHFSVPEALLPYQTTHRWPLPWPRRVQSTPGMFFKIRFNNILPCTAKPTKWSLVCKFSY